MTNTSRRTPPKRRKPPSERKDRIIRVRVSDEQQATLNAAATRAGADLSTWLRMVGLRAASQEAGGVGASTA